MMRLAFSIAAVLTVSLNPAIVQTAAAQNWGCSTEKCLVSCQKAGGKNCSAYCDKAIRAKQQAKTCK